MLVDGTQYRTIWPADRQGSIIRIIDQRYLPHRFQIEDLTNLEAVCTAISEMQVRGAGLIGAAAGFGMHLAARSAPDRGFQPFLREAAHKLRQTRPTAGNLAWAVDRQLTAVADLENIEEARATAFATACQIADEDADFCRQIGIHGLSLIQKIAATKKKGEPVQILTHCNAGWLAFVDHGSATAPIYAAQAQGIPIHVWVDETRPWLQGARLTAWEFDKQGIPHTLIADNTGGHLMQHGLVDMVIVGADRVSRRGDVANKIGTYLKALAAFDNGLPFYVALPSSTFDWSIFDGLADIPIEERNSREITHISGLDAKNRITTVAISPPKTAAANYGFDVTPSRLISGLITERGICDADELAILEIFPEKKRGSAQ